VLNAFRHHGIGHLYLLSKGTIEEECSTPSGIMESVTTRNRPGTA